MQSRFVADRIKFCHLFCQVLFIIIFLPFISVAVLPGESMATLSNDEHNGDDGDEEDDGKMHASDRVRFRGRVKVKVRDRLKLD